MTRVRLLIFLTLAAGILTFLGTACDELITETVEVTIAGHPTAEFTYSPDSGCIPVTVTFEDESSGPIERWIWTFGDGVVDTLYLSAGDNGDVIHIYDSIGTYTVALTVADTLDGSDREEKRRAVIVGHNIDSITISDTLLCTGDSLIVQAFNPVGISNWRWQYGNGVIRTDSGLVQSYAYPLAGVYEFKLTVTGDCGQSILIDTIHVINCGQIGFTMSDSTGAGCSPLSVDFTPPGPEILLGIDTVGIYVDWQWDFDNGSTSTEQTPTEVFTEGEYEISLTLTTDSGGVVTFYDSLIVWPAVSDFTAAPRAMCETEGYQFLVAFQRDPTGDTAWFWDFGDGDTSNVQNPYHAYTEPGVYDVTLTAFGACGADEQVIVMNNFITYTDILDTAGFEITDTSLSDPLFYTGLPLTFADTSHAAVLTDWFWEFGDGNDVSTSVGQTQHIYDSAGTFVVRLTISNECDTAIGGMTIDVIDTTTAATQP